MDNKKIMIRFLLMVITYPIAFGISYGLFQLTKSWDLLLQLLLIVVIVTLFFWFINLLTKQLIFHAFEGLFVSIVALTNVFIWNLNTYFLLVIILIWGLIQTIFTIVSPPSYFEENGDSKWFFVKNLFINHLIPGLISYLIVLSPIRYLFRSQEEPLNLSTLFSVIISSFGLIIYLISTIQKMRFDKHKKEGILDSGLWKLSRHPDAFGKIVFWFGIFLMMLSLDMDMWILFLGPLLHFLFIAGYILPREEKRLLNEKEDYKSYQQRTNLLLVWPKDKSGK